MAVNIRLLTWQKWNGLSDSDKKKWAEKISQFCGEIKPTLRGDTIVAAMAAFAEPRNVESYLNDRKNFVMAIRDNKVVGLLGMHSAGEGRFMRDFVAVLPVHEREGIATKLMLASNSIARRKKSIVDIDFRSPEGRNFGAKIINQPRRKVYQKGKPVHWAEEYDVTPEIGNIHVRVRTQVPFAPARTQKSLWQQLKTRWRMFRRGRKR